MSQRAAQGFALELCGGGKGQACRLQVLRNRWQRNAEEGFTLIELIVCILIISILAAAATQIWFHQRRKGWVAQVHATIRHMAGAQNHVIYNTENGSYTLSVAELEDIGFNYSDDVIPEVVAADRETFCVQMTSAHDPTIVWHYNSVVGYPVEGPGTEEACGVGAASGSLAQADTGGSGVNDDTRDSTGGSGTSGDPEGASGGGSGPNGGIVGAPPGMTGGGSVGDELENGGGGGSSSGNDPAPTTSDPTWDDQPGGGNNGGGGGASAGGGAGGSCKKDDKNDPDGNANGGQDAPGGIGGTAGAQDCNNGSGNDADGEDDNNGGGKNK